MNYVNAAKRLRCKVILFALSSVLMLVAGCATVPARSGPRPESWASPVAAIPGLPNLYRVNSSLYRSAQPTKEGFEFLDRQTSLIKGDRPIKTVVSLRAFHDEAILVPDSFRLRLEQIWFKAWHPENEDVVKFLRIATTPDLQPVLVHCNHGSDRTGTMVAIYRVAIDGWTKAQAKEEMIYGGFGFHKIWLHNLPCYIDKLDVNAIKAQVNKQGPWR